MCTTMNELESVVADYRSLKALKEQVEEELKRMICITRLLICCVISRKERLKMVCTMELT